MREFDVVVIGAGPAGEVAAGRLAEAGMEVCLVERELVGGDCSFWACMPSKALLRPAEALDEVGRVPGAREAVHGGVDVQATLARRDEVVHDFDDSSQLPWIEDRGITLVRAHARLAGERRVEAGGEELVARRAVIVASGSDPSLPPVDGLEEARPWTPRDATSVRDVPGRLLILGGGVVGVEMAQAHATLGAEVTLVEPGPRVLSREEEFAAEQVRQGLEALGVRILCGTHATAARRGADGTVALDTDRGETLEADELLVAAGRRPRTRDLGLEAFGLKPGETIDVDDQLRVPGHPWLMAIGDVNGRQLLTHMGKYQARVAADVLLGRDARLRDQCEPPPRVIFTEPQVAAVGHTLESAREAGIDARAADVATSANAGASFKGKDAPGTCRLVVDRARKVVVGATFTGVDVQEMLHAATLAVTAQLTVGDLWHATPAFPTRNEVWLRLVEQLEDA